MLAVREDTQGDRARKAPTPRHIGHTLGWVAVAVAMSACGSVEALPDADVDDGAIPATDSATDELRDAVGGGQDAGDGVSADAAIPAPEFGWTEVTPEEEDPGPGRRQDATMAYDAAREQVILFGGRDENNNRPEDTWAWDGDSWTDVTPAGDSPVGRDRAAMVYDAARERIVLFGGVDDNDRPKSTWEWDGENWDEVTAPDAEKPGRKVHHAMAYDEAREVVVLYSGQVAAGTTDLMESDTWEWDSENWDEVTPSGEDNSPPPLSGHKMAYDPARERVILHGGRTDEGGDHRDTWEWNGFTWVELASNPLRRQHAIVRDAARNQIVFFGGLGSSGDTFGDTRIWIDDAWSDISDDLETGAPVPRFGHEMAYDIARDRVVLYGGRDDLTGATLGDTWEFFGGNQ